MKKSYLLVLLCFLTGLVVAGCNQDMTQPNATPAATNAAPAAPSTNTTTNK